MIKRDIALPLHSTIRAVRWDFMIRLLKRLAACLFLAVLAIGLCLYLATHFWLFATDWHSTFYPATVLLLHGQNPYSVGSLHNPVWTLFPLIPFALLGEPGGAAAQFFFTFFCYAFTAYRLKAKPIAFVAFLLSPLVIYEIAIGNIDGLVLLGFLMPAPLGLFFAVMKPQIGSAVMLYWAYRAWKDGGLRKLTPTFLPVCLALLTTFLVYGNWFTGRTDDPVHAWWNASFFPWSLPIGTALLYFALRKSKIGRAIAASPCLSPYVGIQSWSLSLVALLEYPPAMVAATIGTWAGILLVAYRLTH